LLNVLALPAGLAIGVYLGLKYWHWAVAGYEGESKMRPVNQREPF
jgi:hypothetical protein